MPNIENLQHLISNHPVIDSHCHNILSQISVTNYDQYPLESLTSEANGEALSSHATETIAHQRAVGQLAKFYNCDQNWEAIKIARQREIKEDYEGLVKRCLAGTHALLIDDGLTDDQDTESVSWHDSLLPGIANRLLRIEAVAAKQMEQYAEKIRSALHADTFRSSPPLPFDLGYFQEEFKHAVIGALDDPSIAGFKSVICYRTGLKNIEPPSQEQLIDSFAAQLNSIIHHGNSRICTKALNDYLVRTTLQCIQERCGTETIKPIQFHTGLGDADITLELSNPAQLQSLIEEFPNVDFVLLHSSYPYTREAGYLASMYKNVYLDLSLVFPVLSRDGQLSILRQSLELAPTSKILWSTDGHFHPETYWLSNRQFREALNVILVEYVERNDFTVSKAMGAAKDIMFRNSNQLYQLNQTLTYEEQGSFQAFKLPVTPSSNISILELFLKMNCHVEFIWVLLVDYTATVRVRMFPCREFSRLIQKQRRAGIAMALLNMLQNDSIVPPNPLSAGEFYLIPDLNTLNINLGIRSNSATVMTFWETQDGKPQEGCPRTILQNLTLRFEKEFGLKLLCGFEIEVVFMKKFMSNDGQCVYEPWLSNHSWSNMTSDTRQALPLIEEIVHELAKIHIYIEQFHSESSPGQLEFILPPASPLTAADTLIKARQTIVHLAEKHDLRATLYPRPFSSAAGTAAHVHISINPATKEEFFLAGLLKHFPAVLPFTFPQDASYERVKEGIWAGGVWVAWGQQNRETPIRRIDPGHWEIKSMDGLANPYLGVAALLAAGYLGLKSSTKLEIRNCTADPATLSPAQREKLAIQTPLPSSLNSALDALEADLDIQDVLGTGWVKRYIGVRRGEQNMLNMMNENERRKWLITRY
ncbi:hypothetical protein LOZ53_001583 [Ophidiomyces ophidiicola]|uniref:uncharacterized protein n=1 Tax=Ophidiomyces ophidiicola TaxID=1387563 RepID=UPI0020C27010|nr:uncharacterized protein LOZ57_001954 [Ophidiomyces ophidiicola]KAI1914460.1 hypothetical protein LOZ61_002128 [Ophidiomyces ophidiicola]KAI1924425.1 hypothetical protein LOZ60_004712 [Ophidiomyces ophidiicola]KAI1950395.1 hypothetical protein LOZ57_001954 [Ophidiomyces ophidiicola]KAI1981032.1 hypothetical protein LOZ55_000918 [Ophidiomyces ophidiicola]KAI1990502.1 hypothetical protein LOZ51_004853 [Ophidiomyces ophidiicola]